VFRLYVKHLVLRTPLEAPAFALRSLAQLPRRLRHPELHDLHIEDDRIVELLRQKLGLDSNCIDVGSHIGGMLAIFLRISPRGKHVGFEPVTYKAGWLKKKFPEVEIHNAALAETAGEAEFSENISKSGFSSLGAPADLYGGSRITRVRCETLDGLLDRPQRFALLKIDVEGAELFVLRGGRKLIARDTPWILFESSHDGAARLGLTREALFAFLREELNYEVYLIKDVLGGGKPLDLAGFQQAAVYPFKAINFVAAYAGANS
jgi:FkbM family methyltransferase